MENSSYNPEYEAQLENIEFYKKWVKDSFDYEAQKNDSLYDLHAKITSIDIGLELPALDIFYDIDMTEYLAASEKLEKQLSTRINEQLAETATDLQENVFDANLFEVHIVIDGGKNYKVETVTVFHGRVVPLVDGKPYHWPIEGISFK